MIVGNIFSRVARFQGGTNQEKSSYLPDTQNQEFVAKT